MYLRIKISVHKNSDMQKIDMHTHILPEQLPNFADRFGYGDFIHLVHQRKGYANMMKGDVFFREITENCWNPDFRIHDYAQFQTDVQVVCTIPVMFSYWAKAKDTLALSEFLNDHIAEICTNYPKHYIGLGTIPMQDTDLAIKELERCKALGMPGIQIGSNVNQLNLNEAQFLPIFEACEAMNMAVFVHPWEMMGEEHIKRYWLPWLVGMPAETARAVCSFIFGGIFEKFPKLRVNFAHAGGSFLPTLGRITHGYNCRPDLVAIDNARPPQDYLGHFWVDCVTHDATMLHYILNMVGEDKVTLGSDYPFPLGDLDIGAFIETMGLSENTKHKIYVQNTLDWLGMNKG